MSDRGSGKNPEIWAGTVLLSLFSSALCALSGLIYLLVQWQNPIWDQRVKLFFIFGILIFTALAGLLGYLYRKRIK